MMANLGSLDHLKELGVNFQVIDSKTEELISIHAKPINDSELPFSKTKYEL